LFFVAEGALEVRVSDRNTSEIAVDCLAAGDIFGEISLLTGEARHATIVALTAALLYEVRKEDLAPLLRRRPELGAAAEDDAAARTDLGARFQRTWARLHGHDPAAIYRVLTRFYGQPHRHY